MIGYLQVVVNLEVAVRRVRSQNLALEIVGKVPEIKDPETTFEGRQR